MIQLYDNPESGNCYKVRLLLTQLGIPFVTETLSVTGDRDAQRGSGFFAKNPIGRIPTVELEDGRHLSESTAILWYFAEGTALLPDERLERARTLAWMAFEQNNHEPNIATARHQLSHEPGADPSAEQRASWLGGGNRALAAMERHLESHDYFGGERYTIADIALFGYTPVAEEGGFDLGLYPRIQSWIERVRSQPRWIPMK